MSTMKRRHSFGPIFGGDPVRRRPSRPGSSAAGARPCACPARPCPSPGMTLPSPSLNVNGCPGPTTRRTRRSCSTSARRTARDLVALLRRRPVPLTMSSIWNSSGGSSSGTVTFGLFVTSVLSGAAVAFGVGVAPSRTVAAAPASARARARGGAGAEACDASQPRQGSGDARPSAGDDRRDAGASAPARPLDVLGRTTRRRGPAAGRRPDLPRGAARLRSSAP